MKNNLDFLNDILSEVEKGNTFSAPKDQNTEAAPKDHFTLPKGISFDSNQKLSQREASNLIQQAQDKAEEVDTIAFGLELNDGEIVKVYVATSDAEAFEKAMSELLGKEDDIETAINDLASEFDIVSVEWPEDDMTGDGSSSDVGDAADNAMSGEEGDGNVDDLADKKEKKTKLGFDLNQSKEEDEKDDNADKDEDNLEAPDDDKDKEEDDAFGGLDFGNKDDEEKPEEDEALASPEEDEAEEPEDTKKKPAKKKKKPAPAKKKSDEKLVDSIQQPSSSWLFSSFLKEEPDFGIISEESKKEDEAEEKIEDLFKTAMQRKIIRLIILLGMPALRLSQGKSLLRHGVREAALGMVNNPKGRIFLHRSLLELEDILGTGNADKAEKELATKKKDDDKEKIDESAGQGTNVMFEHILELLQALGVPHQLLHTRKSLLRQALKPTIVHLIKHGKLRNYIAGLSKALGIKPVHLHKDDDKKDEDSDVVKEAVDLGNDTYLSLVSTLASSLGIPDENLNYKRSVLIQSLRQRKQQLNLPAVRVRAAALAKALASGENMNEEFMYEEASRHLRDNAVDLGAWSIGKTGERVRLAIDSLEIKLSSTEAKTLHHAIDNGFETTVRSGNEHFNFKPVTHGIEYVVTPLDSDNEFHKDGIKFGKKSVEAFLNLW